jgi:hypothetical protein
MRKYMLTADCPVERLDNIGRGIGDVTLPEGTRFTIESDKSRVAGYPLDRSELEIGQKDLPKYMLYQPFAAVSDATESFYFLQCRTRGARLCSTKSLYRLFNSAGGGRRRGRTLWEHEYRTKLLTGGEVEVRGKDADDLMGCDLKVTAAGFEVVTQRNRTAGPTDRPY